MCTHSYCLCLQPEYENHIDTLCIKCACDKVTMDFIFSTPNVNHFLVDFMHLFPTSNFNSMMEPYAPKYKAKSIILLNSNIFTQ